MRIMADAQQALGFLVSQLAYIEREAYLVRYPGIQYPALIPVDTSAPEWTKSVTFYSLDQVGRADWFHHMAKDLPLADVERNKFEQGIEMAGIGYRYTLEELGQSMMIPGMNLTAERASAARRAYEEFVDLRAMVGDENKGWTGLVNNADVTAIQALPDGTGSSASWEDKTAVQILRDVNEALTGVYTESRTVEMADTILLPIEAFTLISTMQIPNTTMTVLQFLQQNNAVTAITGQPIVIRAVRGLHTAGDGGTGRMVVYRRDPQVVKMHIPMPHRFLPVWQTGPITFDIPGIFRFGGVEIRIPAAFRYVDDITGVGTT